MPINSTELIFTRREEILNACRQLYKTKSFKEITIKEIGNITSFNRTSIYNYFQTKEEIFLALMQREYDFWNIELKKLADMHIILSIEGLADRIAVLLEKRTLLLKLLAMNLYDIEENSRTEKLIEFKLSYKRTVELLDTILIKHRSNLNEHSRREFIYAFLPFLFGIYPYTYATQKQLKAMSEVGLEYPNFSVYEIVFNFIKKLLQAFRDDI